MEEPIKTGEKLVERNPDGTIKKGALNPNGRPKGSLSFSTKWDMMVDKLAKQNNITPAEIDEQLLLVAYKKAKEGDFNFYRDTQDRRHGRPKESIDHTSGGKPIALFDYTINENRTNNSDQEDTEAE